MLHGSRAQSPPTAPVTTANSAVAAVPTANSNNTSADIAGPITTASSSQPPPQIPQEPTQQQSVHAGTKRKADSQENERLSKRLSLLNLERNGPKLYVPVETPSPASPMTDNDTAHQPIPANDDDDDDGVMQLDDSKHKVYIYNIDDELSSDDNDDEDGRLIFLPDIRKHLQRNRIPPHILPNSDGELAGMQMVLYSDPKSLSVSEDKDSVRKAIIESRHRLREKQRLEREGVAPPPTPDIDTSAAADPAADDEAMDID